MEGDERTSRVTRWLAALIVVGLSTTARADLLCGSLSGTLPLAGSPHVATCDVFVDAASTLTIEAGVEIRFQAGTSFTVFGMLDAPGTPALPIFMVSDAAAPAAGDWVGLTVEGSADATDLVVREATSVSVADIANFTDCAFSDLSSGVVWERGSSGSMLRGVVSGCDRGVLIRSTNVSLDGVEFDGNAVPVRLDVDTYPLLVNLTASGSTLSEGVELETAATWMGDGTLRDGGLPYVVDGPLQFAPGSRLTLSEGVVMKLGPAASLHVDGLDVTGTPALPVFLVALADDDVGGDTNRDGSATSPAPGAWLGLTIDGTADVVDLAVRHATAVTLADITHFTDSAFSDLSSGVVYERGSSGSMVRGVVAGCDRGVFLRSTNVFLDGVDFDGNAVPVRLDVDTYPLLVNLTASGSTLSEGVELETGATWMADGTFRDGGLPYVVDAPLQFAPGSRLTLSAGVVMKLGPAASLHVDGLDVTGTPALPVFLVARADDDIGGDTNRDGSATSPAPGAWLGLTIDGAADAVNLAVRHATVVSVGDIAHFTDSAFSDLSSGVVYERGSSGSMVRGVVAGCDRGVFIRSSNVSLDGVDFDGNTVPVRLDVETYPLLVNLTASGSTLSEGVELETAAPWTQEGTLGDGGLPYVVNDALLFAPGSRLTLSEGVVMKLGPAASLHVDWLDVTGTPALPVRLVSLADDDVAGDTNRDGSATSAAPGDWLDLTIGGTASVANLLVRHATAVSVAGIAHFTDSAFSDLSSGVVYERLSSGSMLRGVVAGCERGVFIRSSNVSLDGVEFDGNAVPVRLDVDSHPLLANLTASSSAVSEGVELETAATWTQGGTLRDGGLPYVVDGSLRFAPGTTLSLAAGVVMKLGAAGSLHLDGLDVMGTPASPVWLLSRADDSIAGDTNRDGSATAPAPGDWLGLTIDGSSSVANLVLGHSTAVDVAGAASFTDCAFSDLTEGVVYQPGSSGSMQGGFITRCDTGALVRSSNVTLDGVTLDDNRVAVQLGVDALPSLASLIATNTATFDAVLVDSGSAWSASGTLHDAGIPYVIASDWTFVPGGFLRLDAGTLLKVAPGATALTFADLEVAATPVSPAILTSLSDDSAGGDTNRDGPSVVGAGEWGDLTMVVGTSAFSAVVRGASAVRVQAAAEFMDCAFEDIPSGIVLEAPTAAVVTGCAFTRCDTGVSVLHSTASVDLTSFTDCGIPVRLAVDAFPRLAALTATGSRELEGVLVDASATWSASGAFTAAGLPYVLEDALRFADGSSLTLEAGTSLKFDPSAAGMAALSVPTLLAMGTAASPVTLASLLDDATSGDTNRDGSATAPAVGDWTGVELRGGDSSLEGVQVTHATVGVRAAGGTTAFRDGSVRRSVVGLAYEAGATGEVTGSTFQGLSTGVLADTGATPDLGNVGDALTTNDGANTFTCNVIHVDNRVASVLQAEGNWWGDDPPESRLFLGAVDYTPHAPGPMRPEIDRLQVSLVGGSAVRLGWPDMGPTCGYRVFRGTEADGTFDDLSGWIAATSFDDVGVVGDGRLLFYDVHLE